MSGSVMFGIGIVAFMSVVVLALRNWPMHGIRYRWKYRHQIATRRNMRRWEREEREHADRSEP